MSDRINLSALDAISTNGPGNDAIQFIGDLAFRHSAGELRFTATSGSVLVQCAFNGAAVADFAITQVGKTTVNGTASIV